MEHRNTGRVQDKLLNRIERQEKQLAFQRERFFRFKLPEIHKKLSQTLLMEKIIETENPTAISEAILKGLKKALNSSEFDHNYFVAPIRNLVSRPNPYSLYMTQYIMEVLIDDPNVIDIYGTDLEIYRIVNNVFSQVVIQFERAEEEVKAQLARNKSLILGSREYEMELDLLMRKKIGEPQKQ
jgi:hypothetical protein